MKHLLIAFLFLTVCLSNTVTQAQSTYQASNSGLPAVCNILDFALSSNGTIFTIVSIVNDKAYIYKSTDNGASWSVINQTGLPTWFNSIEYINNSLLIGTWEEGSIVYKSTDEGLSWNASNAGIPATCNLLDFTVANGSVYAIVSIIGDKAYIYKSTDNGVNWSAISQTGLPTWFNSLGTSNNDLLVGTWEEGSIMYKSIDNGLSWSSSNTGLPPVCNILSFAKLNGNVYALVSIVGDKAYIYNSANNGANWAVINQTGLPNWFNSLGFSNNALFVGTWEEGSIMYRSEIISTSILDGEQSKEQLAYPNPADNHIYFMQSLNVELFSENGSLLISKADAIELDVAFLKPGVYFLKTEGSIQKIIKK
jgi:photosystem II stability/assembly factor-like uncharacterized protein